MGKALLKEVFYLCNTEAPSMGLYLHVNRSNKKAQSFYLKHGALKHDTSTWTAPDGSSVPSYLFVWCKLSNFSSQG